MPTICADAGLVPCADMGIKHIFLALSPLLTWKAAIAKSPAYSP